MRQLILITSILLFLVSGCKKKETEYQSKGIIYGPDPGMCICCGGWIIELDENREHYRFVNLPKGSNIDLKATTFPISVKLNWTLDYSCSFIHYIAIDEIELIE